MDLHDVPNHAQCPLGSSAYVLAWLRKQAERQDDTMRTLDRLAHLADPKDGLRQIAWHLGRAMWNQTDVQLWTSVPQSMMPWLEQRRDALMHHADSLIPGAIVDDMRKRLLFLDAKAGGLGARPQMASAAI